MKISWLEYSDNEVMKSQTTLTIIHINFDPPHQQHLSWYYLHNPGIDQMKADKNRPKRALSAPTGQVKNVHKNSLVN
jgi:hypothetical protein